MSVRLEFDTVVVGGGTAGCVLANRLSADPAHRVALVEAGPDFGPVEKGCWPAEIESAAYVDTTYDWGYATELAGRTLWYKRGKVMGGSSSINGCYVSWGLRQDYDEWRDAGNPGWGFEDLLPCFHRVERLVNDNAPSRGTMGQVPVTRNAAPDSPYFADLERTYRALGLEPAGDASGPHATAGFGQGTRNSIDGQRYHSARAYLDPVRHRPNLVVLDQTTVDRVRWQERRATGLTVRRGTDQFEIAAGRVVLAAGTVGSALILMRSGVGPANLIRRVMGGIRLTDLPGVGRNLHDHCGISVAMRAAPGAADRVAESLRRNPGQSLLLRLKTDPELDAHDLNVFATLGAPAGDLAHEMRPDDEVGSRPMLLGWSLFLMRPVAEGYVEITGSHPAAPPRIVTGFGDPRDLRALARGIEWVRRLACQPVLAGWLGDEEFPGANLQGEALERYIMENVWGFLHCNGTCKLGPDSDPLAVVDATGKVYGFENLYVADASIMPTIPRGGINLTVYAVAEKIAAGLGGTAT